MLKDLSRAYRLKIITTLQVVSKFVPMTTSRAETGFSQSASQSAIHETDDAFRIELQGTLSITITAVVEAGSLQKSKIPSFSC